MSLFSKTDNNSEKVVSLPKLKQRQRILNTVKALLRITKLTLFICFVYSIYLLWNLNFWKIEYIELNGLTQSGFTYINNMSLEDYYLNKNIITIDPYNVKEKVNNKRLFRYVDVRRRIIPTVLTLNFTERKPYLTIYDISEEITKTIDIDGIVLPFIKSNNNKEKSIYEINEINNYSLTPQQLKTLRDIQNLRENNLISNLGTFNISDSEKITLETDKYNFLIGSTEDIIYKLKTVPYLSKSDKNEIEYIDIRFWKNPVLKLKRKR